MAEILTRVRWNDDERETVAGAMAQALTQAPGTPMLEAVRQGQLALPEGRRRDLKAWSVVQAVLQDKLDAALARLKAAEPADHFVQANESVEAGQAHPEAPLPSKGEADLSAPVAHRVEDKGAPPESNLAPAPAGAPQPNNAASGPTQFATVSAGSPQVALALEAAMLAALQSPAVADALVEVFGRAMAKAFSRMSGEGRPQVEEAVSPPRREQRVLLAGFPTPQVKSLEDVLRRSFDVRVWRPGQGPQLFETLAGMCSVAVIPEASGEDVDEALRRFQLQILRHEGSAERLAERLEEAVQ